MKISSLVQHRETKTAAPGGGLSASRRSCGGACGLFTASKGGGLIEGRWYCATCRPRANAKDIAKWINKVRAHLVDTGGAFSPAEAVALFGAPPTRRSAADVLYAAMNRGVFTRDIDQRYRPAAANTPAARKTETDLGESYFTGLQRVRSVFDLGGLP